MRTRIASLILLLTAAFAFAAPPQYRWGEGSYNGVWHAGFSDESKFPVLDGGDPDERWRGAVIFGTDAGVSYVPNKALTQWVPQVPRTEAIGANVAIVCDGGACGVYVDGGSGGGGSTPPTWHYFGTGGEPAYQNGFTPNRQHRYAITGDHFVHIELGIINPGANTTGIVVTMPAGFRPAADILFGNINDFLVVISATDGTVNIATNTMPLGVPYDLNFIYSTDP